MNIVKEIAEFYEKNENSILKSLTFSNKDSVFFILDKNFDVINISHLNKGNCTKISGDDYDLDKLKYINYHSGIYYKDANDKGNYCIGSNCTGSYKKIMSVIPEVVIFKKGKYNEIINNEVFDSYYEVLGDDYNYDKSLNIDELKKIISYNYDKYIENEVKYNEDLYIHFIIDVDIENYKESYNNYLKQKIYSSDNFFAATNGANGAKLTKDINNTIIYDNFYLKKGKYEDEIYMNFINFMRLCKNIPNKYLILNRDNIFDKKQNIEDLYEKYEKEKEDLKLLHINYNGQILLYDYIKINNYKTNYLSLKQNMETKTVTISKYNLYQKIISIFDNTYIDFFNNNKEKTLKSVYNNTIHLGEIYDKIKDDIKQLIFFNNDIDYTKLYFDVEKFVFDKNLNFRTDNKQININKDKLIKLLELKINLTPTDMNVNELKKKIDTLKYNIVYFNNQHELEEKLNEKGILLLANKKKGIETDDENKFFQKNYDNNACNVKYLQNVEISKSIVDIETFSYMLGDSIKYWFGFSKNNDICTLLQYFKNLSVKEAINKLLELKDKYKHLEDNDKRKFSDNTLKHLLSYVINNNENKIIDYIYLNLGFC